MNIEFTRSFDEGFRALPGPVRQKSRKAVDRFLEAYETRRFPKGLRIHKCGPFMSISVTMQYRIFVHPVPNGIRFVFIGGHEDADRYLKR